MDKDKLNKRYKALRWTENICFWLGVAACIVPMLIASVKIVPAMESSGDKWAFGGVAIFFTAIVVLVLAKNLVKQLTANIPCALTVFVFVVALLVFIKLLSIVISDALAILTVGAIGSFFGVLLQFVSIACKHTADDMEIYYKRGKYEVNSRVSNGDATNGTQGNNNEQQV